MTVGKKEKIQKLSVVVVTVYSGDHLATCLDTLTRESRALPVEIIAVFDDRVRDITSLEERFPEVRFLKIEGTTNQEHMRTAGIKASTGDIVALTVDHSYASEYWCAQLIEEHRSSHAAIGGGLEMGTQPETIVNSAVHFYDYCNYGYYQQPVVEGPATNLSDCNSSYKRADLEDIRSAWENGFQMALVNWALRDAGKTLWMTPRLLVHQCRDISLGRAATVALRRGRVFASLRAGKKALPTRLVYALASVLLPVLLLRRLMTNFMKKRVHVARFVKSLPVMVILNILWSLGEMTGYLTGTAPESVDVD